MKQVINEFNMILQSHPFKDYKDYSFLIEHDVEKNTNGIVFSLFNKYGVQRGMSRKEFLNYYSDYSSILPQSDDYIINFLEFSSLQSFKENKIEKAYIIDVDKDLNLNDREFKGLAGRPIALDENIQALAQISVSNTDDNFSRLPDQVKNALPNDEDIEYVRYNNDLTRISYEKQYTVDKSEIDSLNITGINTDFLKNSCYAVLNYTKKDSVRFMVKTTGDKNKIYFELVSVDLPCEGC